jgi:hypothetical protein
LLCRLIIFIRRDVGMSSSLKKSFYGIALIIGAVAFFGCSQPDNPVPDTWDVTITQAANGSISANPVSAVAGTAIALTVTPDSGYVLKADSLQVNGGAVELSGSGNNYSFAMPNGDAGVEAVFEALPPAVNIPAFDHGTITANPAYAAAGTTVTLTVSAAAGFGLQPGSLSVKDAGGTEVPVTAGAGTAHSFTMPGTAVTVSAVFEALGEGLYSVSPDPDILHGTVEADLAGAAAGAVITLTVTPDPGYGLQADSLKVNGGEVAVTAAGAGYTFAMPAANVTVTAAFEAIAYSVTVGSMTNGSVAAGKETATIGETITLTVAPDPGYALQADSLTVNDGAVEVTASGADWTFSMPAADAAISAAFELRRYDITLAASVSNGAIIAKVGGVTVTGAVMGATVTLTAEPEPGYELKAGTLEANGGDVALNGGGPWTFTMPMGAVTLSAVFEEAITEDISFYEGDYSSLTQFDEDSWTGVGTANEAWTLKATEQNWVYFAVYKTAEQKIAVDGAEADVALVAMTETGSVAGAVTGGDGSLTASDELTVFAVDTRDLVFEGGERTFDLKVSEDGKRPKTVSVTVKNNANTSGAALFLVTRPDGKETLTRKDTGTEAYNPTLGVGNEQVSAYGVLANPAPFNGLFLALVWVDHNTGTEQEWLIRVEAAQTEMSKMALYCQTDTTNYASNVTIRLRGMGNTERIVKWNGNSKYAGSGAINNLISVDGLILLMGNSRNEETPGITFQLEKNITLRGMSLAEMGGNYTNNISFVVGVTSKSSLVMKTGSKLTGQEGNGATTTSVIRVATSTNPASVYPVKIEAGAEISGNLLTHGGEASGINGGRVINVNPQSSTTITTPKVFISKDAIITNNGHEGADAVVFKSTGEFGYFISTEADNILPPVAELPK